ncbi:MAG: outer membrane lipoprotein-sorting protein, partial [Burkholderiales bacterium PBB5]
MRTFPKPSVKTTVLASLLAAASLALTGPTNAGVSEQEAAKLGKELTPVGAERAGNKDGSIPEWKGGDLKAPAGWKVGAPRPDPYAGDALVAAIDAGNVDKYKDKLSEGQIALIKQLKGYKMNLYPSHRSCGYPDAVNERTRANATGAAMAANGFDMAKATPGGVPFPIPKNGA